MNINKLGFLRTALSSCQIKTGCPEENGAKIIEIIGKAEEDQVGLLVFPQLAITGVACGDLFFQPALYNGQEVAFQKILEATRELQVTVVLGLFRKSMSSLVNSVAVIKAGQVINFQPLAPSNQQKRWFAPVYDFDGTTYGDSLTSFQIVSPSTSTSTFMGPTGITISMNDCPFYGGKDLETLTICKAKSIESGGAYLSISPPTTESGMDYVYGGHCLMVESGHVLAEQKPFQDCGSYLVSDIDCEAIQFTASHNPKLAQYITADEGFSLNTNYVEMSYPTDGPIMRKYDQYPFIPKDIDRSWSQIFQTQSMGLAQRLRGTRSKKSVIGISGGLDSTLALLVCHRAHEILGLGSENIVAVTMPGLGTTDKTYNNALDLMEALGVDSRQISIGNAVKSHFGDIGHDGQTHDVAFENAQARERTQVLMDLANMESALVVGTGDLSEAALGWATYNGDHMSMYNVNCNVSKTLVAALVARYANQAIITGQEKLGHTLKAILNTPISPELLPPDSQGQIAQKTEDKIGPYKLHDFFIFHTLSHGMTPEKLGAVAGQVFEREYDQAFINKWLNVFYSRFLSQQFKRSCSPEGPAVTNLSLSPRGGWVAPSVMGSQPWEVK